MVRMARVVVARLTRNYNHDGLDRLVAASDPDRADTYAYDANGNLIDDGDHTYTYSARNRLVQVDNGDTAVYRYNALGQRIHKQAGSNVDYAALAAEYQQLADDLAAEATALSEQAQTTLDSANEKADQAEHLNQEALALRQQADTHEQEAAALREQAAQLRNEAKALIEQAEQKEAEALPLQEQADALFAEAAALREQADQQWQAAESDQQRADDLAANAQARREHAAALDRQADDNDRIAQENRVRAPQLRAEAEALRQEADEKEAAAQPYLEEVEKLEKRIAPVRNTVERFENRGRNVPKGLQKNFDTWVAEQAEYQATADALLADAESLREQAEQNDQLAEDLLEEADRLEAEAVQLRAEAEEERTLADQEEAESADYARQAEVHRTEAQSLDDEAQAREDEAQPLADQAQTLRTEAEALRADAEAKTAQAEASEQEADDLDQLTATKRADADQKEQQAGTLNTEAVDLYTEADQLQTQADEEQQKADAAQQQADEYAELAENPPVASEEQYFVYSQDGRLIGRYDESGNAVREYFRLGNIPVAVAANDDLYYIHSDQLGTPRAVSEPGGNIIWSWISDPFGDTAPNEDPDGDGETFTLNLRFAGQYFDAETGLHQNWWRSYSPDAGRYITPDSIGLDGGLNAYQYAGSNSLDKVDPTGLLEWEGSFDVKGVGIGKFGGFRAKFMLTSECDIDGQQGVVVVKGWGATAGIGIPVYEIMGTVKFEDGHIRVNPDVFEGSLRIDSLGFTVGPGGVGVTNIGLGGAVSTEVNASGLDAGISIGLFGSSQVVNSVVYKKCGCNEGTKPVEHSF